MQSQPRRFYYQTHKCYGMQNKNSVCDVLVMSKHYCSDVNNKPLLCTKNTTLIVGIKHPTAVKTAFSFHSHCMFALALKNDHRLAITKFQMQYTSIRWNDTKVLVTKNCTIRKRINQLMLEQLVKKIYWWVLFLTLEISRRLVLRKFGP